MCGWRLANWDGVRIRDGDAAADVDDDAAVVVVVVVAAGVCVGAVVAIFSVMSHALGEMLGVFKLSPTVNVQSDTSVVQLESSSKVLSLFLPLRSSAM